MDTLLLSLSFWIVFHTAESDDVGPINCKQNVTSINCPLDSICSGSCEFTCADIPRNEADAIRQVWGTKIYTSYSSICKAATHDLRISTWDTTKRFFTLKHISYDGNYWASVRSGIRSFSLSSANMSPPNNGSFIFLSPRVNETILDVASIHEAFIFSETERHVQICFGEPNANPISIKTFIPEASSSSLTPEMERMGKLEMWKLSWPKRNGEAQSGGFQCVPQKSMLSVVTFLAMSSNADFYPTRLTHVANINEDVTLVMKEHSERSFSCASKWRKDDEELPEFIHQSTQQPTSLFLPNIQEGSQGIYSLECAGNSSKRGLLRLIVRACPANKYGDNCTEQCPECKNGGVCHDITGVCICPPGFNGTTCENDCPSGYFGQTCSMSCPTTCKGYLICFPDPYGCSCASGYKGISCNESYPVLMGDVTLKESTTSSITISFREWDSNVDTGNGTPSTYKVFYKRNSDGETWISKDVIAAPTSEKKVHDVTLQNLETGTEYVIRVVILDESGQSQEEGVKEYFFSTLCGSPMEPPSDINITTQEREVSVSWKVPSERFWNCKTIKSIVKYNSGEVHEEKLITETVYRFTSKPFATWSVTVCVGQKIEEANCAETKKAVTKEGAPGKVEGFAYTAVSSRSINLTWENPREKNGVIKYFALRYSQTGWKHHCEEAFSKEYKNLNSIHVNVEVANLNPSTNYQFVIQAVTVKHGPAQSLTVATEEDVPSEGPTDLQFDAPKNVLRWRPPSCISSNGELTNYQIIIKGLTSLDNYERKMTTKGLEYRLYVLPETEYYVKVFASTEAGLGKSYAEINFQTLQKDPAAPSSITVMERTTDKIVVTWKPPLKNNVYYYYISMIPLDSGSSENDFYSTPHRIPGIDKLQFHFLFLMPATAYMLCIEAYPGGYPLFEIVSTRIPEPEVSKTPKLLSKTDTTITVKIFPTKAVYKISYYFVVVKVMESAQLKESKPYFSNYDDSFFAPPNCDANHEDEYIAGRLESVPPEGTEFTVGEGLCIEGYFNKPLTVGTYQVGVAVVSEYHNDKRYSDVVYLYQDISVGKTSKVSTYTIIMAILGTFTGIIFIFIIIFALPFRVLLRLEERVNRALEILPCIKKRDPPADFAFDNIFVEDDDDDDYDDDIDFGDDDDSIDTESIAEEMSRIIPVKDLEKYIIDSACNTEMKKQFKNIPRRYSLTCQAGKIPRNRLKNRYGNLLPYDHSRVKLKPKHDDPSADYINANYVCGYKNDKKYIATQGPLPKTLNDFWRMVMEENACKILMVTNLGELGRVKCEKYWPDETAQYGSITVTLKNAEVVVHYAIRTFEIRTLKETREVKQFHYLAWPDHGVPPYATPLIRFLQKARDYEPTSEGPVIVHCSAGVGRTGTTILLDSMVEMGMAEGQIDVCAHLSEMRKRRINLVESLEQFVFVHKALEQALCLGETSGPCADLIPNIRNLRSAGTNFTALELQYHRLEKLCPRLDNASMRVARLPDSVPKNRTMNILPPEKARPILQIAPEDRSSYINAVYVNGYKEKDAFVVTQYPLPDTISDFWQTVYQTKSRTIVLLQDIDFTDRTCPQYWPSEGETVLHGKFRIQCISVKSYNDIHTWNLTLTCTKNMDNSDESPIPIKLFHYLAWTVGKHLPQYPQGILDLVQKVENAQGEGKHIITVQCFNGSTACGVFCAAMFVIGKMISEQEVDTFLAVQNIRPNRPQFIENFEQYDFLYDVAVTYMETFGAYANFV